MAGTPSLKTTVTAAEPPRNTIASSETMPFRDAMTTAAQSVSATILLNARPCVMTNRDAMKDSGRTSAASAETRTVNAAAGRADTNAENALIQPIPAAGARRARERTGMNISGNITVSATNIADITGSRSAFTTTEYTPACEKNTAVSGTMATCTATDAPKLSDMKRGRRAREKTRVSFGANAISPHTEPTLIR